MNTDKSELLKILDDIRAVIEDNANADGSVRIDIIKARLALEFARTSIENAIL